jgi:Flp pilus assembly protein TadD
MEMVGNLHLERAIAHKVEGDYEAAIAELRQALIEEPNSAEAHHQLGLVFGFVGEFDDSLSSLKRAVDLRQDNVPVLNDLAKTYAMLGMYEEARAGFEEVLRLDPGNETARQNMMFF